MRRRLVRVLTGASTVPPEVTCRVRTIDRLADSVSKLARFSPASSPSTDAGVGDEVQRRVEALGLGHLKELAELGGGPDRRDR